MNARTAHWARWLRPSTPGPKLQELKQPDEPGFLTLQLARKRVQGHYRGQVINTEFLTDEWCKPKLPCPYRFVTDFEGICQDSALTANFIRPKYTFDPCPCI